MQLPDTAEGGRVIPAALRHPSHLQPCRSLSWQPLEYSCLRSRQGQETLWLQQSRLWACKKGWVCPSLSLGTL